jgi:hypothetical protein
MTTNLKRVSEVAVIPAALSSGAGQAGIQCRSKDMKALDPGFRRDDEQKKSDFRDS